jgi:hypothetical protein
MTHPQEVFSDFTNPRELPSLEEIERMDKKREAAINSLEISDGHVKCQKCGQVIPIIGKLQKSKTDRIASLEKRIKRAEFYYKKYHHDNSTDHSGKDREELAALQQEDAERDKLRCLPLYRSKRTGYRFFCSSCFDACSSHRRRSHTIKV